MTGAPEVSEEDAVWVRALMGRRRREWLEPVHRSRPEVGAVLEFAAFWSRLGREGLAPAPGHAPAILTALTHWAIPEDFTGCGFDEPPELPSDEHLADLVGLSPDEVRAALSRLRRLGLLEHLPRKPRVERLALNRMAELREGAAWKPEA